MANSLGYPGNISQDFANWLSHRGVSPMAWSSYGQDFRNQTRSQYNQDKRKNPGRSYKPAMSPGEEAQASQPNGPQYDRGSSPITAIASRGFRDYGAKPKYGDFNDKRYQDAYDAYKRDGGPWSAYKWYHSGMPAGPNTTDKAPVMGHGSGGITGAVGRILGQNPSILNGGSTSPTTPGALSVSEYEKSLSAGYEAARQRIAQKYANMLAQVDKSRAIGHQAIGELPGHYNEINQQSQADLRSFAKEAGDPGPGNVLPISMQAAGYNAAAVSQPFLSAVDVLNKERLADLPLLQHGEDQYIGSLSGQISAERDQELADLEKQRQSAIDAYNHDINLERQQSADRIQEQNNLYGTPGSGGSTIGANVKSLFMPGGADENMNSALRARYFSPKLKEKLKSSTRVKQIADWYDKHQASYNGDPQAIFNDLQAHFGRWHLELSYFLNSLGGLGITKTDQQILQSAGS